MMQDMFSPPTEALAFEPEELAVFLLTHLSLRKSKEPNIQLGNYFGAGDVAEYCESVGDRRLTRALTEAWIWLDREGMLAPKVEHGRDWVYVTRKGNQLLRQQNWESYYRGTLIREVELAPALARKVLPMFLRGDYEAAMFQAFKQVEVEVRRAAGLPGEKIDVPLMRDVFHPEDGPL